MKSTILTNNPAAIAVFGSLTGIYITWGGMLSIKEAISCVFIMLVVLTNRVSLSKNARKVFLILILLSIFQLLSDIWNFTQFGSSVKGVGAYIVCACTFSTIYIIFRNKPDKLLVYITFTFFALSLELFTSRISGGFSAVWKSQAAYFITIFIFCIFSIYIKNNLLKRFTVIFHFLLFSIISLLNDFRSCFIILLFSLLIYLINIYKKNTILIIKNFNLLQLITIVFFVVIILNYMITNLFLAILDFGILNNVLNDAQLSKYSTQLSGEFGLLAGGRTEFVGSLTAFLDSPIFGHGSWPIDATGKYYSAIVDYRENYNYSDEVINLGYSAERLIPTHSHLWQGLVWSGIFSGLLWISLLYLIVTIGIKAIYNTKAEKFHPVIIVATISTIWNIMFSPFGFTARIYLSITLAIIVLLSENEQQI